jgi:hypothetical protein
VRVAAILGAAVVTLSLAAASGGGAAPAREGGTFRVAKPPEQFDSIDAALTSIAGTITVVRATCAGLMRTPDKPFLEGLRVIPDLAADYPKITWPP